MTPRFPARLLAFLLGGLALTAPPAWPADVGAIADLGRSAPQDEFLPQEEVFQIHAEATAPDRIEVSFSVHKGYYLYRDKLKFAVAEGEPAALGTPALPEGEKKTDEYFGEQVVYHHDFVVKLPVSRGSLEPFTLPLKVSWQGCAEAGLCYPPTSKTFDIEMPKASAVSALPAGGGSVAGNADGYVSKQDSMAGLISSGNIFLMAGVFFLAGLALAFTPCVLPMVPIVAGIIAGGGPNVTR
ncbi:MAG: hypothetical protein RL030_1155, partial [Pseudomonadota bacterium]